MNLSAPSPAPRATRLFSLVALTFGAMLLAGADGGCTITITPTEQCTELDDVCPNLECEVFATNDDGCALCECAEAPVEPACESDGDCPVGDYCHVEEGVAECRPLACPAIAIAPPNCTDDEVVVCEEGDDPCLPFCFCEPIDDPPITCANVLCNTPTVCVDTPEGPKCVPEEGSCDDDSQVICDALPPACGEGRMAAIRDGCWVCVDAATCQPTLGCEAMLCAPDTVCEETPEGPMCVPVDEEEPVGCYSDEECGADQYCNAVDVCLPPPGCEGDANCVTVCYGSCVEA